MDPPHRRCLVRAGLGSVQQGLKVAPQVHCVVRTVLSVHAHRAVFASAVERLCEPVEVNEVGQRREFHLRTLSSEFCDPLLFRGHVHGFRCTRHVSLQRFRDTAPPVGWSTGAHTLGYGGGSTPFGVGLNPAPMVTVPAAPPKIPYGGFSPVRLQLPGTTRFSRESSCSDRWLKCDPHIHRRPKQLALAFGVVAADGFPASMCGLAPSGDPTWTQRSSLQ